MIDKILKDVKDALKIDSPKEFMIGWLPYILIFYLGNIFAKHVNAYVGGDIIDRYRDWEWTSNMQALAEWRTLRFFHF